MAFGDTRVRTNRVNVARTCGLHDNLQSGESIIIFTGSWFMPNLGSIEVAAAGQPVAAMLMRGRRAN